MECTCRTIAKRSNNTVSFLQRNLSSCPKDVNTTCYKPLVRHQLENGATVWDTLTKSNTNKLEAVLRRAARFCHSNYQRTSIVTAMTEDLGWEQLEARPQQLKAAMLYRIINHHVDIQATPLLIPAGTQY